jgi:outer membrane protein OmpA-like peptidoglycan-associated protein
VTRAIALALLLLAPEVARADAAVRRVADQLVLPRPLRFEIDAAEIVPDDVDLLRALAGHLNAHPEIRVLEIRAHVDHVTADRESVMGRVLSRARARAIVDALVELGVRRERVRAVALGDAHPICDARGLRGARREACLRRNRRFEYAIVSA